MKFTQKNKTNIQKFIFNNKILEANFFNVKNFSFFINKYNFSFFFYDHKKIFGALKKLIFIINKVHISNESILFVGLHHRDSRFYSSFNKVLKALVIRNGHLYSDFVTEGSIYDHFSFYKRRSLNNLNSSTESSAFKGENLPQVLVTFSRTTSETVFEEFSSAGIPIFYFLGESVSSNNSFKDYPLFGIYSKKMLNFYLDLLNYSFRKVDK